MRILLQIGALLSLFCGPVQALEFETYMLDNGLQVIVVEDHRAPVIVNFVWYKIGAGDEVDGSTGLAHMLEHMMFKGTEKIPAGEFSKIIARNGGRDNAFTSYDYTAYFQKIAKDQIGTAMEMEAERMHKLTFAEKDFTPERDVVMEERRWRTDSKPDRKFLEELQSYHLPNHPYGRPVIGWKQDIENFSRDKNLQWYKDYYAPNNAVLILYGDITLAEAKPLVEKTYATVPSKDVTVKKWTAQPLWNEAKRFEKENVDVKVPMFVRSYRAPSSFANIAGQKTKVNLQINSLSLDLMSQILGSGQTSRLYKVLVEEKKLANSASASYYSSARGESSVDISVQPKPGVKLSAIEKAVDEVLAEFTRNGVTEDEIHRARTKLVSSDVYARDDPFISAYRLGIWLMTGGKAETFDNWLTDIAQLNTSDVQAVANAYLNITHSTTGYLAASKDQF